jgi:hypothetical protein
MIPRVLMSLLALVATAAGAGPLAMTETAGIRWVCGGVGADERGALGALEPQANLKVLFVTVKRGGYLADAELSVYDAGARPPRLKLVADGPICLLSLPAGAYRLEAGFGGATRSHALRIGAQPAPARVVFAFPPPEPWDGIWASDEEKRQATSP